MQKEIGVSKQNGAIKENGLVIQNITIRPVQRPEYADVDRWRTAHKSAEAYSGIRTPLYDLYSDALLDTFLGSLVKKRILNVTKHKLKYLIKDKEVEGSADLLNKKEFRKLRKAIQNSKAWGIGVIELMNVDGKLKIFDVPKKHIHPETGIITKEQLGMEGINYRTLKTVIEIGEWDDLGYLLEATPCAFLKRGNIGDWANYAQMFGMPFREARYDGFNEQVRIQLEKSMEQAASAAYIVLPREAEIKLHEVSNSAGSNTLYDTLRMAMNEEMSVHILGSTETTVSSKSSGYAQSETHRKTTNDIAQDDKEDELAILNDQVLDILVLLGLLPRGGTFVYDEPIDLETAKQKVSIGQQLKLSGVPIGDDYFYEVSGVPRPADYDMQKEAKEQQQEQEKEPADDKEKKPDKKLSFPEQLKNKLHSFFD
ncbi:MAG: DUF935 family protein [Verrucomicrobia bacterium]|nr:DUF935 family protein [Verrucomicrobiota bacterium]